MASESGESVVIRAALRNYYVVGLWVLIAFLFYLISLRPLPIPEDSNIHLPRIRFEVLALFFSIIALCWSLWLLRLKITVSPTSFEYRNGFYRFRTLLSKIENVKDEYIPISLMIKEGRRPKFIVTLKYGDGLAFKTKPFKREDLVRMFLALKEAGVWKRQDSRINSIWGGRL